MEKYWQSPDARRQNEDGLKLWGSEIFQKKSWSVAYRKNVTYSRPNHGKDKHVIQIISCVTPSDPETAEKFYRWYDLEHTSEIFRHEAVVKAGGYRRIQIEMPVKPQVNHYPYHLAVFEFQSRKILDAIMAGFKGEPPDLGDWGPEIGRKKVWMVTYAINESWER